VSSQLDTALRQIDGWPVPTAAAAVVGPGGVLAAHGPTDRVFALASVTKPLAAYAVLVAVEEGAVELDDPVEPYGPPGSTLRHLLAHTSGLVFDGEPAPRRALARPGASRIYSNAGFEAMGEYVAHASGIPFEAYVAEAVCAQLDLPGTALRGSPAYGASSTVDDLAVFAAELLRPALLHSSTLAEATSVQFPGLSGVVPGFGRQDRCDWGLGFELRDGKAPHWTGTRNSPRTFGHFGRAGTFIWVDPVADLALVALTDREFDRWAKDAWQPFSDAVLQAAGH
jgi:CubicO group peptidase (beta-lactamase class C family)